MRYRKIPISYIGIIKFLLSILMIYEGWYIYKFGPVLYFLQALTMIIFSITFIKFGSKFINNKIQKNSTLLYWLGFVVFCFFTAFFCEDTIHAIDGLTVFVSFLIILMCTEQVVEYEQNVQWFEKTMIVTAALNVVCVLFFGQPYINGDYVVITMGEMDNPNTLGLTLCLGLCFLLMKETKVDNRMLNNILKIILACSIVYVVINTGSRSALICCLITVVLSVYNSYKYMRGASIKTVVIRRAVLIAVSIVAVVVVLNYFTSNMMINAGIQRFYDRFNLESILGRTHLYEKGWELFISSPIWGVGYKCFEVVSGYKYFSHSTYIELLSCCGFVGTLLFLIPYFKGVVNAIKMRKSDSGKHICILTIFFLSGFFGIWYYDLLFLLILYISLNKF